MGFYLRKGISVGPLRFNLSKSGIGVSAGVKGFRVGAGPRGNYIHMGRGGMYYRATLPSAHPASARPAHVSVPVQAPQTPAGTHAPLEEFESANITQLVDTSSRDLLSEMNKKQQKTALWPFSAFSALALLILSFLADWSMLVQIILILVGGAITYAAYSRDVLEKTVVLFYGFDAELERAYEQLHAAGMRLAECAAVWHVAASGRVYDPKYHAGAGYLLKRSRTFIRKAAPPYVKTNIETLALGVGRQTLYFFPDRILVYDKSGIGAIAYSDLNIDISITHFIENDAVPRDAKIVDRTWRYVNKSGGADRRFKNNRQLPICLYQEVKLSSRSGLNELVQLSKCDVAEGFRVAVSSLSNVLVNDHRT